MTAFCYRNGVLHAETVPLPEIAAAIGTPTYVYSARQIEANYHAFTRAFAGADVSLCYALKANGNQAIIRTLARLGAGADVVSGGELERALAAGIPAGQVVFSGVGKTAEELRRALELGIFQINVESLPELELLSAVAVAMGVEAPIALRVNPDVDARTHAKIATGKKENKFGIDFEHAIAAYHHATTLPGLRPVAVAVHIGSQLTDLSPFRAAFGRVAELVRHLRQEGIALSRVDLGGGLGISYRDEDLPDLSDYATVVRDTVGDLGCHVTLEPGRALVGNAGVLLARTLYVKQGVSRRFLILDAAMNDLIRPSLYDAWHNMLPVDEPPPDALLTPMDVVGPICETGDTFARQRPLPPLEQGDLVAILAAGAYGAAMSSTYNARPLTAEVLVDSDRWAVIRRRQSIAELIALDHVPEWLRPV